MTLVHSHLSGIPGGFRDPQIYPASQLSHSRSSDSPISADGWVQVIFLWVWKHFPSGHGYVLLLNPSIYYVIMLFCMSLCLDNRSIRLFGVTQESDFKEVQGLFTSHLLPEPSEEHTIQLWGHQVIKRMPMNSIVSGNKVLSLWVTHLSASNTPGGLQ